MLLCEVALGEVQICKDTGDIDSTQYDSVQALGETIPNPFHTIFDKRGVRQSKKGFFFLAYRH